MRFSEEAVRHYLKIVQDDNPIHEQIVPGQMVVEQVWREVDRQPSQYNVKYRRPVNIDEVLDVQEDARMIRVIGEQGAEKLVIQLSDEH